MAISTSTQDLINYYQSKKKNDERQKDQIESVRVGYTIEQGDQPDIKVIGALEIIDKYDEKIKPIDERIIAINDNIKSLQQNVLSIGQTANSVGCGTITWSVGYTSITIYQDNLRYKSWSLSGDNPFNSTSGSLISSNSGIGTYNYINQVSIGTYFAGIDSSVNSCTNLFTCTSQMCIDYQNTITSLNTQIVGLTSDRDELITRVNELKRQRFNFELQDWGYRRAKQKLDANIQESDQIIEFLSIEDDFL